MTKLTIQYKRAGTRKRPPFWEDRTVVAVFNPEVLEREITTLIEELPEGIASRVKVETEDGTISYRW